jgi:iron complex transport system permease protein
MRSGLLLGMACVVVAGLGLAAGASGWRWDAPLELARGNEIVAGLRAPRVALALIVGAALATAGLAMQTLLRNDLADPYILGLSGGASAGAVASLALIPALPVGVAAALGAAAASALVRLIARRSYQPERLVLGGVAVGALCSSVTGAIVMLAPGDRALRSASFWLFGGMGTPGWSALALPLAALLAALAWIHWRAARLDRLSLGESVAASLGVDVRGLRRECVAAAVILTGACVAVAGLIGFVGLVAPHLARRLLGGCHRESAAGAALIGATLVGAADVAARALFAPRELPVGMVTAAIGAPFFLWLLYRGATP